MQTRASVGVPKQVLEIVPDYFVNKNDRFIIVDPKFTTKELDDFILDDAFTKNQDEVFNWIKNNDVEAIELRANTIKSEAIGRYQGYLFKEDEIKNLGVHIIKSKADKINEIETTYIIK